MIIGIDHGYYAMKTKQVCLKCYNKVVTEVANKI